jgi:TetR/AcrR family transcriptional regulator, transcriptional repressor for nem operon
MQEVGLTHGGFYGHFNSRDDLVNAAFSAAVSQTIKRWENAIGTLERRALKSIVKDYLSPSHRDRPETGCPLTLFAIDASRGDAITQKVFADGLKQHIALLEQAWPTSEMRDRRQRAVAAVATLVGAVLLARATSREPISDEMLKAASNILHSSIREA